jgi:hypothetical protein
VFVGMACRQSRTDDRPRMILRTQHERGYASDGELPCPCLR